MASDVKLFSVQVTPELVAKAFMRGVITAAEVRAMTALMREQRLASGAGSTAASVLQEFMREAQSEEDAPNGRGKSQ